MLEVQVIILRPTAAAARAADAILVGQRIVSNAAKANAATHQTTWTVIRVGKAAHAGGWKNKQRKQRTSTVTLRCESNHVRKFSNAVLVPSRRMRLPRCQLCKLPLITRCCVMITFRGKSMSISQCARSASVPISVIARGIRSGDIEAAIDFHTVSRDRQLALSKMWDQPPGRSFVKFEFDILGVRLTVAEIEIAFGISAMALYQRLRRGYLPDEACLLPMRGFGRVKLVECQTSNDPIPAQSSKRTRLKPKPSRSAPRPRARDRSSKPQPSRSRNASRKRRV